MDTTTLKLGTMHVTTRADVPQRQDKHWQAIGKQALPGFICQMNTLNQFHESYLLEGAKFQCPVAMCGYFAAANTLLVENYLKQLAPNPAPAANLNLQQILDIFRLLTNQSKVDPVLKAVVAKIQKQRHDYFSPIVDSTELGKAMRNWVANYEISDVMRASSRCSSFIRYNQFPSRSEATMDEFDRLEEEKRFGGRIAEDGVNVTYAASDSVYFVETFSRPVVSAPTFLTPDEWQTAQRDASVAAVPLAFALDMNGHYVSGMACRLDVTDLPQGLTGEREVRFIRALGRELRRTSSGSPVNVAFIFNTMPGNCTEELSSVWSFDTMFPPAA